MTPNTSFWPHSIIFIVSKLIKKREKEDNQILKLVMGVAQAVFSLRIVQFEIQCAV